METFECVCGHLGYTGGLQDSMTLGIARMDMNQHQANCTAYKPVAIAVALAVKNDESENGEREKCDLMTTQLSEIPTEYVAVTNACYREGIGHRQGDTWFMSERENRLVENAITLYLENSADKDE